MTCERACGMVECSAFGCQRAPSPARTSPGTAWEMKMRFDEALKRVRAGARIMRRGWSGTKLVEAESAQRAPMQPCVFLVTPASFAVMGMPELQAVYGRGTLAVKAQDYLAMVTTDGSIVPWLASQTDILADDWHAVGGAMTASEIAQVAQAEVPTFLKRERMGPNDGGDRLLTSAEEESAKRGAAMRAVISNLSSMEEPAFWRGIVSRVRDALRVGRESMADAHAGYHANVTANLNILRGALGMLPSESAAARSIDGHAAGCDRRTG